MVRAIILRVEGTNCEQEMMEGLRRAGSRVDLVHINELRKRKKSLEDYQILGLPGGFAHGDDIAAGKILAIQMKYELGEELKKFVEEGKLIIGVCNGFQALVKCGLLPALDGIMKKQEVTLALNDSGYFIDMWIHLKPYNECIFTRNIDRELYLPIAHGEGKFFTSQKNLERLEENGQIVFRYVENPNGSLADIAGICNLEGNVFGMMPHPERYLEKWTHPYWTRINLPEEGDGMQIFRNAVEYARKKL